MLTQSDLNQFCGSEKSHNHFLKRFTYTDGVKYLAEKADAHWIIDAIASYQPALLKDPMLRNFQAWKLTVNSDNKTAKLICEKDTDVVMVTQDLEFTDFPLPEVRLYLCQLVLMLPSEY